MTGYQMKVKTKVILLAAIIFLTFGCEQKETSKVIVAKVGNSVLTEDQLDTLLSFSVNRNKYESEVIRDWIESEVLFNEAKENGILESADYLQLVESSNKKLANTLYLKSKMSDRQINTDDVVLKEYFDENKQEFSLNDKAYVYNMATFNDEEKAIHFRSTLTESDWSKTVNVFSGDQSLVSLINTKFSFDYDLPSEKVQIILQYLKDGETSIIFETEPGYFNIIQLEKTIAKNSIPGFEYIKESIKARYLATKLKINYDELLQGLFAKYDVIINR